MSDQEDQPKQQYQNQCNAQNSVVFTSSEIVFPEKSARSLCEGFGTVKNVKLSQANESYRTNETVVEFETREQLVAYYKWQQNQPPMKHDGVSISFKMMRQQDYLVVLIHLPRGITSSQLQKVVETYLNQRLNRQVNLLVDIFNVKEFTAMGNVQLTNAQDYKDAMFHLGEPHFTNAVAKELGMTDIVVIDKITKDNRYDRKVPMVSGNNEIAQIIASAYEGKNRRNITNGRNDSQGQQSFGRYPDNGFRDHFPTQNQFQREFEAPRNFQQQRPYPSDRDFRQVPNDQYQMRTNDYQRPIDYPRQLDYPRNSDYQRPPNDYQRSPTDYYRPSEYPSQSDFPRQQNDYPHQQRPQYDRLPYDRPPIDQRLPYDKSQHDFRPPQNFQQQPEGELSPNSVFVGGVIGATEIDVKELFSSYGVQNVYTLSQKGEIRDSKSFLVFFEKPEAAQAVLDQHKARKFIFNGREIIVNPHRRKGMKPDGRQNYEQ